MKKTGILCYLLLAGVLWSCKDTESKEKFLPESTGGINSLLVVMDTELWKSEVGDKIREHFAAPVLGLPQAEPQFTITQVPPQIFKGATTRSRAILWVAQGKESLAHIKTGVYAQPQKIAVILGETYEDLAQKIDSLAPKAITTFKKVEIKEAQKRFTRSLHKDKTLEEEFGIHLNIPSLYTIGKREKNFVWMDLHIPKGTVNLIAYTIPWSNFAADSIFADDIIKMRDSIGKKYIPGPYKGTFMATEKAFSPYMSPTQISGKKAIEVRGIWEISGYPMAGPFLTYIINDKENHRKLVLEGFTFAPSEGKRDYMFELEAILKTLKFKANP